MRIVVFGFDAAESSQIRRIRALLDAGYEVSAFTMRRRNMNEDFVPFWDNVHLFTVENENLAKRVLVLTASIFKIAFNIGRVRRADVLVARNFDLLLLAVAARFMALQRIPVVYECLDIHAIFTDPSRKGALFRFVERMLLARTALVVVSSPGFVDNYFRPVQRYRGPVFLLENKIWFSGTLPERRGADAPPGRGTLQHPYRVGWVGSLRCEPSFSILSGAARQLGERVRLEFHGNIHEHVLRDFDARLAGLANVAYHGPYSYPAGLAMYRTLDFVWAQDLWQRGANSDWLLPNRIYEASYYGCLSIAVAGTQTARTVEERGLGYVVPEATAEALASLIAELDPDEVATRRAALLARPTSDFVTSSAEVRAMIEAARGDDGRRPQA